MLPRGRHTTDAAVYGRALTIQKITLKSVRKVFE